MIDFSTLEYQQGISSVYSKKIINNSNCRDDTFLTDLSISTELSVGIDEAGRGPLLGPVAVAAVILNPNDKISGLTDSKKLSEKKRQTLFKEISNRALAYEVLFVSAKKIDEINILQATLLGMREAGVKLLEQTNNANIPVTQTLIDGNKTVELPVPTSAIVGGDALHDEISAASILAKVCRDEYMYWLHAQYPDFSIDKHKGYPTKLHKQMIETQGILPEHRHSFNPIKSMLASQT